MLHTVYLAGLCQRRQWPDPYYQISASRNGYSCVVRVNNREYQTSKYFQSEATAKEAAALVAFNICRSFSVNDGMYPTGFAHDNVIQGRAVPVGAGRTGRHGHGASAPDYRYRGDSVSSGSRSGGSSPDFSDDPGYSRVKRSDRRDAGYGPSPRYESQRVRYVSSRR